MLAGRTGFQVDAARTNGAVLFTWDTTYDSPRQWLWDSVHNGNGYVAVGDFGTIMTSGNGAEFTLEIVPDSVTNSTLLGVAGDTNLLVAVGDSGKIVYSTNGSVVETNLVSELGINWQNANSPTAQTLQGVALYNGEFYVAGNSGALAKSANGRNWNLVSAFTGNTLTGLAASDDGAAKLVAVGDDGTAYVSSDGVNYLPAAIAVTTDWLYRVRYLNSNFVIVGQNGTVITSGDNAVSWTTQTSGTTAWLNDVIHVGDRYYAVGTQGALIESTNLVDWTSSPMITGKSLYSLASNGGQMIATGIEGLILRSRPAPFTNEVQIVSYSFAPNTNNVFQSIFLFAGETDQKFDFDVTGSLTNSWNGLGQFEITDPQGFFFHIENVATNTPPISQIYRTSLVP